MNRDLMFSTRNNAWCTPQDFFDELNKEFQFNFDPCATEKSAKCGMFFTAEMDGLKQGWFCSVASKDNPSLSASWKGRVFMNPPLWATNK